MKTNQEILEMLSTLECVLFYRADYTDSLEGVSMKETEAMHAAIKKCLEKWHTLTGCVLQ